MVNNLACVNDPAEHGVALIQTLNATMANEDEKQFLQQDVEDIEGVPELQPRLTSSDVVNYWLDWMWEMFARRTISDTVACR